MADPPQGLYVVADGMGGAAAGAFAAQAVINTLPPLLEEQTASLQDPSSEEARGALMACLSQLSRLVYQESVKDRDREGMGSTVVMALTRGNHLLIAHVGDSRAYLLRKEKLEQLTTDHTLVQLLVETGDLTAEEARHHPARSQLTRCIGMEETYPDVSAIPLHPGDRLLLCSDGLTGMVSDGKIRSLLGLPERPEEICRRLVEAANAAGGTDNITTVVLLVE